MRWDSLPKNKKIRVGKEHKFFAKKTKYNGVIYSSILESEVAIDLDIQKNKGLIKDWTGQVPIMLGIPENKFFIDFLIWLNDGTTKFIDAKGKETPKSKKIKKLWKRYGPTLLEIHKKIGKKWTIEYIEVENK